MKRQIQPFLISKRSGMVALVILNRLCWIIRFICAVLPIKLSKFFVWTLKFTSILWIGSLPRILHTIYYSNRVSLLFFPLCTDILAECQDTQLSSKLLNKIIFRNLFKLPSLASLNRKVYLRSFSSSIFSCCKLFIGLNLRIAHNPAFIIPSTPFRYPKCGLLKEQKNPN